MINIALKLNNNYVYIAHLNNIGLQPSIQYITIKNYIMEKYFKYLLYYTTIIYCSKIKSSSLVFYMNYFIHAIPLLNKNFAFYFVVNKYCVNITFKFCDICYVTSLIPLYKRSNLKYILKIDNSNKKFSLKKTIKLLNIFNKNFIYFLKMQQLSSFFFKLFLNNSHTYNTYSSTITKYILDDNVNSLISLQTILSNYLYTQSYFKNKYNRLNAYEISSSFEFILFNDTINNYSDKIFSVFFIKDNFIIKHGYLFSNINHLTVSYNSININSLNAYRKNCYSNYNYKIFNIYLQHSVYDVLTQRLSINLFYDSMLLILYFQQLANNLFNIIFNSYRVLFETGVQPYVYTTSLSRKKFNYLSKFAFFDLYRILICTFKANDINLFKTWIIKAFSQLHFKQHKFLCYMIRFYIRKMFIIFKRYSPCTGVYIRFKGKISVGGNSRKRSFTVKLGTYSLTSKNKKLEYLQFYLLTQTGILGVKLMFSYK